MFKNNLINLGKNHSINGIKSNGSYQKYEMALLEAWDSKDFGELWFENYKNISHEI